MEHRKGTVRQGDRGHPCCQTMQLKSMQTTPEIDCRRPDDQHHNPQWQKEEMDQCHRLKVATCESHSHFSVNGRGVHSRVRHGSRHVARPAGRHSGTNKVTRPTDGASKKSVTDPLSQRKQQRVGTHSMIPTVPGTCIHRKSAFSAISDHTFRGKSAAHKMRVRAATIVLVLTAVPITTAIALNKGPLVRASTAGLNAYAAAASAISHLFEPPTAPVSRPRPA